ncbi:MAG TPA: glutathione synthase [Gammaproteobacteria bacterium]|nr:glutathione synthase [Gammaproteobacteria bacterium]
MIRIGVIMDPIGSINPKKDSTLAMMLEAQRRGWELQYMELADLHLRDGRVHAHMQALTVYDDEAHWFDHGARAERPLGDMDVILMRKDPPIDMEYMYASHLLEIAEREGVRVVNRPQSLRDVNEKLYTAWFPQCTPPTLVTRSGQQIRAFLDEHDDIIVKPLYAMGGESVFRVNHHNPNVNVIIEIMTARGQRFAMAQRYIPEILDGDKRILMIGGEPVPYALARIPAPGETRANLATGGTGEGVALTERDRWICGQVGPVLREKGLLFVGLDVIGDYLTEINVTSPTCIRELDRLYGLNISALLMDRIERELA